MFRSRSLPSAALALSIALTLSSCAAHVAMSPPCVCAPDSTWASRRATMRRPDVDRTPSGWVLDPHVYHFGLGVVASRVQGLPLDWAVNYTWEYFYRGLPEGWYDGPHFFAMAESLRVSDDVEMGLLDCGATMRVPIFASVSASACAAAMAARPAAIPRELAEIMQPVVELARHREGRLR